MYERETLEIMAKATQGSTEALKSEFKILKSGLDASNFDLGVLQSELEACSPVGQHSFPWHKVSRSQTDILDCTLDE